MVPHGALPIKISCNLVITRASQRLRSHTSAFIPGPATMVIASPLYPCAPCGPLATSAPELASGADMHGSMLGGQQCATGRTAAPLHFFSLLLSSSYLTKTQLGVSHLTKLIPSQKSSRHRTARSTRTTSLTPLISTHLHSFSARSRGSPVLTQISQRIDPDIHVSTVWCSGAAISGSGLGHDWRRNNAWMVSEWYSQ